MRASKIGLVESLSSVARLLLEPQERSVAAAVLSDAQSTCILVSLLHQSASSPEKHKQQRLKAPCCSDACFLRLEVGHGLGSGQRRNSSMGGTELHFGQFTAVVGGQQQQSQSEIDNEVLNPIGCGRSFFLVASAGVGGSCTDIRAWCCDSSSFRQVQLEPGVLGLIKANSSAGVFARFDIPPAGLKMVASVNVLALYSPSVCKIWIFAVKAQIKAGKHSLLLLNCSILDCDKPVSAIHISTQHLFLSADCGLRILPLRPLVKGRKTCQLVGFDGKSSFPLNGLHEKLKPKNGFICDHPEQLERNPSPDDEGDHQKDESVKNGLIKHLSVPASAYSHVESNIDNVTAIHALTSKRFLVLDSSGTLRVLDLKKPTSAKRLSEVEVDLKTVSVPFYVSSITVVPCGTEAGAVRNLWVTDGKNTIYVLSLSDEMLEDEGIIVPLVTQVVFMGSQIDSMFAVSAQTVLALSQGALVAYVKPGS